MGKVLLRVGVAVAAVVAVVGFSFSPALAVVHTMNCHTWVKDSTAATNGTAAVCAYSVGSYWDSKSPGSYTHFPTGGPIYGIPLAICADMPGPVGMAACGTSWEPGGASGSTAYVGPTSSPFGAVPDGIVFFNQTYTVESYYGTRSATVDIDGTFPVSGGTFDWYGITCTPSCDISWNNATPNAARSEYAKWTGWLGAHSVSGAVDWLTANAYWPAPGTGFPNYNVIPPRPCGEIGISYRTKDVGASSWSPVTLGNWPALSFGGLIEWTMDLDADEQVDHLVFSMIGATPLSYTGDPPNWSPGQLQPFALDLLDSAFLANDGFMSGVGIGAQWEIRPGDAQAVLVGPATLTGEFIWLGHSGSRPAFSIECRSIGSGGDGVAVFDQDQTAYGGTTLSVPACDSWKIVPWEPAGSDTAWGFRFSKVASTTAFVSLEWRTGDGDWTVVYAPTPASAAELVYLLSIEKALLASPSLAEWRCTAQKPGGGTVTRVKGTDVNVASSSDYGREGQDEGCYARATGDLSLTSPKTWLVAGGRIGVCLVEFLVVPSEGKLSSEYGAFEDELELQTPFSFLFILDGFLSDLEDVVTDMEAGDAPEIPIASFTIGGATVDTSGFAPGAVVGDAVEPADRSLLTLLLLGGIVWAVLNHASGLLFGKTMLPDDDPTPTNFGGSGR